MEINSDFIAIQGIFLSLQSSHGLLKNIKYRQGYERTILDCLVEIQQVFQSRGYITIQGDASKINTAFEPEIEKIVLVLILNTDLQHPVRENDEYSHLTSLFPQLSKVLLANIIIGLDLCDIYCKVLKSNCAISSIEQTLELLTELVPCIKTSKPESQLPNTLSILTLIKAKIITKSESNDIALDLIDLGSELLFHLTTKGDERKRRIVYTRTGYKIEKLLTLLLDSQINPTNPLQVQFFEAVTKTLVSIMEEVSVDAFISWAEVDHDYNQSLQTKVAELSYLFIEAYGKFEPAGDFVKMLGPMARKPEPLEEQIQQADVPKIISMIDRSSGDEVNQLKWFNALLKVSPDTTFERDDTLECIEKWAGLLTSDDVTLLMNSYSDYVKNNVNDKSSRIITKCLRTLSLPDLAIVVTRHFLRNGTNVVLSPDITQQITIMFNKILKNNKIIEEFNVELLQLFVQNPRDTLAYVVGECLKNSFFASSVLRDFFTLIRDSVCVDNIGIRVFQVEVSKNPPSDTNSGNYINFVNLVIEIELLSLESVIMEVFLPVLKKCIAEENHESLKAMLEFLQGIDKTISCEPFLNLIFDTAARFRCKFMNFSTVKQEITKVCVNIIVKNTDRSQNFDQGEGNDPFLRFYKNRDTCPNLLYLFYPDYKLGTHYEVVTNLIKILPQCVTFEWTTIVQDLLEIYPPAQTVEVLSDFLILLCQLINSQENQTPEVVSMLNGLKYQLQNFGIVLKECIGPRVTHDLTEDTGVTRQIVHLLKNIPKSLRGEEGLALANIPSEGSLKALNCDKQFICSIAAIGEPRICKLLADKMIEG